MTGTEKFNAMWRLILLGPTWLAALVLFILMGLTFADVVLRSAFSAPINGATELTRLCMGIIVFAALPMVSWKGDNIVVDLFDPLIPPRIARWRDSVIDIACGVVLIWPAMRVQVLAERAREYGDVTEYLHLPQFFIAWFIAIFTFITALTFILRGITRPFAPASSTASTPPQQQQDGASP